MSDPAAELDQAFKGEGEIEPEFASLASAFDKLWALQPAESRLAKPANFRISRGAGRVLQFSLADSAIMHSLRTPEYSIVYSSPPGQLSFEARREDVSLFEPQDLLMPLAWGEGLFDWYGRDWKKIGDQLLRAEVKDSGVRTSVWLDGSKRPVACWRLWGDGTEDSSCGFYEWSEAAGQERFPTRALTLYGAPGGIDGVMYRIVPIAIDSPGIKPVLALKNVSRVVDLRGRKPKILHGDLPEFLREFVHIGED